MKTADSLFSIYKNLSGKDNLYLKIRYLINPMSAIEDIVPKEGRIYDLGCGAGLLSNMMALASEKRQVTGVDLSRKKIDIAQKSLGDRPNIEFRTADVLNFTFRNPDIIVMCDLLHHIPFQTQENLLRRLYNSLNKGGLLLIQDIDKTPFHKYIFALSVDKITSKMSTVYYRKSKNLENILKDIGFDVEIIRLDKNYPIAAVAYRCIK